MEPSIQYATTEDGVSIALWTMGNGTPFVQMPSGSGAVSQGLWQLAAVRRGFERQAQTRTVIRFDQRGFGHSQRNVSQFSLQAWLLDLEAVVDHLALERFVLFGMMHAAPIAIAYAARHPGRVSHLILHNASACGRDFVDQRRVALLVVADADWEFYTEIIAHSVLNWRAGEEVSRFAAAIREGQTPAALRAAMEAILQIDVSDMAPQVRSPVLVLHQRGDRIPELNVARRLVASMPNAQLAVLEGAGSPYFAEGDEAEPFFHAIDEFLAEGQAATDEAHAVAGLVTILFTDIDDSTGITQRVGDAKAQELVRAHNAIVREALSSHGGSEIKHTGDGIMASFPTASGALECAAAILRAADERAVGEHGQVPLQIHIGLNAGEPVAEERDLFGTAVQLARRICDQASGGEVLVSDVVRQLAAGKGYLFADRGDVVLRGFEDPVRLYELRWRADASL